MTALARIPVRHLDQVLTEIAAAQRAFNESWNLPHEMDCLDRLDALSEEARAMIELATGVNWIAIREAGL